MIAHRRKQKKGGIPLNADRILPYVEPIYRFCRHRVSNRHDAEDLAGEILCHILDGMQKYPIRSLDAWVWRIARNRYARFADGRAHNPVTLCGDDEMFDTADYAEVDEEETQQRYEAVFRCLHTLSREYRDIFVDYYLGEMSVRSLSQKYSLPETTVKWRLNAGRQKIRYRIGENNMTNIYQRIHWNTTACNGNMDPDAYLHTQIARAICLASYEKPLTVEEISLATGIPTLYIEDELPRLLYGDAVTRIGSKYAANFIIVRLEDRRKTESASAPLVQSLADCLEKTLRNADTSLRSMDFYGHDFGTERLGYVIVPYLLRRRIREIKKNRLHLENGPYPPRQDGGYGWFIVEETEDDREWSNEYNTGCNSAMCDKEDTAGTISHAYWYWISKYFRKDIYGRRGLQWLSQEGILEASANGILPQHLLSGEDTAHLLAVNLIEKNAENFRLTFPCFTAEQFRNFASLFSAETASDDLLAQWISSVHESFRSFVPARLHDQINQWVGIYAHQIIGQVTEELIRRGILRQPDPDKPLTDGVFWVDGDYIHP